MRLTSEEHIILLEYSYGYNFVEIARRQNLSQDQVSRRFRNIKLKLGGKNYHHCIRLGFESGYLRKKRSTL